LKNLFSLKIKGVENKTEVITNGYDEDDFKGITPIIPAMFTITYVGTLSDIYPIDSFLNAVQIFKNKGHEILLRFIGTVSQNQKDLIQSKSGDSILEFIPYVEHPAAIQYMLKTSVLLLIIPDHQSNKSIITGKIFEYIASGKPIICLGPPDGDAAGIIGNTGYRRTFSYMDSKGISEYLSSLAPKMPFIESISPAVYSRKELTGKIIPLLSNRN
jgi:glycosyltransferase involved in cell wall biosynthesis